MACCRLRHRSYGDVASCVRRLCRVAHWLSHTMLRACCWVCAVRCSPHTKYGSAACWLLHLACARVLWHVVCCLLHVVCCMLPVARCRLFAVCCAMSAVCCLLSVVCCLLPCCVLFVARRLLSFPRCLVHVARCCCPLSVAWYLLGCMSFVVRCMLHEALRMLHVAHCALHVVCCILPAAWRMVSGRCVLHAAWRRLRFHRMLHAIYCLLHWSLARCRLRVVCRTLSSQSRPRCACVRACVRVANVTVCLWAAVGSIRARAME
jgi:hypothetical protein